ncbi:hypothetical protein GGX14DRAFT_643880, partial [Mycena pura]
MALTQSALPPPGPTWEDEVVPALRKRLEGESRVLSKRISTTVSVSSLEDAEPGYQPRASYAQPRTSSDRTVTTKPNGPSSSKRARTYSQPKLSEIPSKTRTSERGQYSEPKPTRIPKAARGAGGIATNGISTNQLPYSTPQSPPTDSPSLLSPSALSREPSQDTIHIPMRQTSGLLNEPPPFMPGTGSANSHDDTPPRPSHDSEESPFEHWYRGEVSRNGGVGELKLGKRQEMLEIANYGHTLKQKQALATSREAEQSNSRRRKRSDSVAALERRESLYFDEERANNVGRVLDEGPLTDVDGEMSDFDYYNQRHRPFDTSISSAPDTESMTSTPMQTPRQQGTYPPASTPTQMMRGASEPPSFPSSSSSLSQTSRQLQNPKRAATSSPPSASTSKKPRAAATPKSKAKAKPKRANTVAAGDKRGSVAYYPSPGDDDDDNLADAIPTWTQPTAPPTGRWDDVVLPVVARKKGLDGLYEKADGNSPQPKKVQPVAPVLTSSSSTNRVFALQAAGTFGWDHTKYRPPLEGDIQMDEFGRPRDVEDQGAFANPLSPPTAHELQPVGPAQQRPPSPAPFSNYGGSPNGVVDLDLKAAKLEEPEDDAGAGCCKCVVM